jgi:sulfur carrier protein
MIEIVINNERKAVGEKTSLTTVLMENNFNCLRVAVAVNSEFVARADYDKHFLNAGDKVDVVAPVAGG